MWLHRIERVGGRLRGCIILENGVIQSTEPTLSWQFKAPVQAKLGVSGVTSLHQWVPADEAEYLRMAGLSPDLAGRHDVYAFRNRTLRFLLPAVVVWKALFRPPATAFEYLFRPSGLDDLLAPVWDSDAMTVRFIPRKIRQHEPVSIDGMSRLQWLYCFPSAREAWDSVYANALAGRIGVSLPKINANVSLRGVLVDDTFLVSDMTVGAFTPDEACFAWAGLQPREFSSKTFETGKRLNAILKKDGLLRGRSGWDLSDEEWNAIQYLFPRGTRGHSGDAARRLISAVLEKLGTGTGWKLSNWKVGTPTGASSFYRNTSKSGRWGKLEAIVMNMRRCVQETM
jgi:hypothetical protein